MDFAWTPEQNEYRAKLRSFLERYLPNDWAEKSKFDPGSPYVIEFAREFCPILAENGLLIPHWPRKYGGGEADAWSHWILGEEMFAVGEPRSYQYMNVNWIGPAIIRYGTEAQKNLHLPQITAGTVFWCQGFSEPSAGSDLAALRTRAQKNGDKYIINGAKIWTSAASFADYCFLLARTSDERHAISVFLLPMKTPGIDVRYINSLTGAGSLHEVFFTDVEVPEAFRLGPQDEGWAVVRSVLHNERIGAPRYMMALRALEVAARLLKEQGRLNESGLSAQLGRVRAAVDAARLLAFRVIEARVKNEPPSGLTSVARYALVVADRAVGEFFAENMHDVLLSGDEQAIYTQYRRAASTGLGAGAAEVQLNLVSSTVLDLPRSPN